jgi:hypothetical protein
MVIRREGLKPGCYADQTKGMIGKIARRERGKMVDRHVNRAT